MLVPGRTGFIKQPLFGIVFLAVPDQAVEEVAAIIDEEIRSIVDHGYQTAKAILTQQRHQMDLVVEQLKVVETLDGSQLDEILARGAPAAAASSSAS